MSLAHLVALSHFQKIGPVAYRSLIEALGSTEEIWRAGSEALQRGGVTRNVAEAFVSWRGAVSPEAFLEDVARRGISVVGIDDDAYPELLKTIHDPPYLIYYRGALPPGDALLVGVVGSRRATDYGLRVAGDLSGALASQGIVIVSGLAWGIDEAAHRATVNVRGVTIAVLGCGLDGNDAERKKKLAQDIVDLGGAVLSEFPPEMPSFTHHFPIRNRIIAGMSKGTIVVEAAEASGSLITARAALAENREVFSVPGPITSPTSLGTNRLIRDGAHVVTCAEDILNVLGVKARSESDPLPPRDQSGLTDTARLILQFVTHEPVHIDDLARLTELDTAQLGSTLTLLEIEGWARHLGAGRYIR